MTLAEGAMRWITITVTTLLLSSMTQALNFCESVLTKCLESPDSWTRCYEDEIGSCTPRKRGPNPNFFYQKVDPAREVNVTINNHRVRIPSSALKISQVDAHDIYVRVVVTVLNSTFFELSPSPTEPTLKPSFILNQSVLVVKAGNLPVRNLSQPIKLQFKHHEPVQNGTCVFWQESGGHEETGYWSTDGCITSYNGTEYFCSCNHLSFFAVLVNPALSVDEKTAINLSYISYIGSAFSVFFTLISLFLYICLHRRRPEKANGIHMQLTGAMLLLHLGFLVSSLLVWFQPEISEGWVCKALGFILHWSLLATFTWTALEGFHLYLLLVRVFNIYVPRYLLKISLVGWGFPTLVAVICGISNVYGKYILNITDANNQTSTGQICWISSQFPYSLAVSYVTTVAFPCMVFMYNGCMLGLVVYQLWGLRRGDYNMEARSGWRKMQKERMRRLWKDSVTVLGLSCVLGLPWGLASITYISLPGIYVFTVFNALQGLFMFLWSLALSSKSKSENNSSVRDPSTQKMMDTSFNN